MSQFQRSEDEVIKAAHKLGLIAVFPRDDELMLDIDRPHSKDIRILLNRENFKIMKEHLKVRSVLITRSKSNNAHVYMLLDRTLTEFERMTLQACLGSDSKREMLSALRLIAAGSSVTTCCYENAGEYKRIMSWRKRKRASRTRQSFGDVSCEYASGTPVGYDPRTKDNYYGPADLDEMERMSQDDSDDACEFVRFANA